MTLAQDILRGAPALVAVRLMSSETDQGPRYYLQLQAPGGAWVTAAGPLDDKRLDQVGGIIGGIILAATLKEAPP